jgi:hypothetical protein
MPKVLNPAVEFLVCLTIGNNNSAPSDPSPNATLLPSCNFEDVTTTQSVDSFAIFGGEPADRIKQITGLQPVSTPRIIL